MEISYALLFFERSKHRISLTSFQHLYALDSKSLNLYSNSSTPPIIFESSWEFKLSALNQYCTGKILKLCLYEMKHADQIWEPVSKQKYLPKRGLIFESAVFASCRYLMIFTGLILLGVSMCDVIDWLLLFALCCISTKRIYCGES